MKPGVLSSWPPGASPFSDRSPSGLRLALGLLLLMAGFGEEPFAAEPDTADPHVLVCPRFPDPGPSDDEPSASLKLPSFVPPELPEPEPRLPEDPLAPASRGSTSLGAANGGHLLRPSDIRVRGPHHRMHPGKEGQRFGTVELVEALRGACRAVAKRYPGSVLVLGNLSRKGGGRIRVSVSHQSGRDADLAFYALDTKLGRPAKLKHFVAFGPDGLSRDGRLRFDAARNWALLEALLRGPTRVQWVFVSRPLRRLLLEQGVAEGALAELLAMAAQVLAQPSDSSPHADHFHLRLHCSPEDILDGCRDYGPRRWWAPFPTRAYQQRVAGLLALLADRGRPRGGRLAAVDALEGLRAEQAAPSLVELLDEGDRVLSLRAINALRLIADPRSAPALATRLGPGSSPELLAAGLDALWAMADPRVWRELLALARDGPRLAARKGRRPPRQGKTIGVRAIEVLKGLAPAAAMPELIKLLGSTGPGALRKALLSALARIASTDLPVRGMGRGKDPAEAWRRWQEAHPGADRRSWLLEGMAEAGYELTRGLCAVDSVRILIPALKDPRPHIRTNARDIIRAVVNMKPWRPGKKRLSQGFWQRWWERVGCRAAR